MVRGTECRVEGRPAVDTLTDLTHLLLAAGCSGSKYCEVWCSLGDWFVISLSGQLTACCVLDTRCHMRGVTVSVRR